MGQVAASVVQRISGSTSAFQVKAVRSPSQGEAQVRNSAQCGENTERELHRERERLKWHKDASSSASMTGAGMLTSTT